MAERAEVPTERIREGLHDRMIRMFAELYLTDTRLAEVVACWPGDAPVEVTS